MIGKAILPILLLPALPCMAGSLQFSQPLDCTLGETCFIQNFVDRDPGPGWRDHLCGALSYDGHQGTDFALPTVADMAAGVTVRAAAPGRVLRTRDGEEDGAMAAGADVSAAECGNAVVIAHEDGWQSVYCHLREGSVRVQPGAIVLNGAPLAEVGMSGAAAFPHLHFALYHNGQLVDPFQPDLTESCTLDPTDTLFEPELTAAATGLIAAGFATTPPDYAAIQTELPRLDTTTATAPALIAWGYGWGIQAGDILRVRIDGPGGFTFTHDTPFDAPKVRFYRLAGKKMPPGGWPPGPYRATLEVLRAGSPVATRETRIEITD